MQDLELTPELYNKLICFVEKLFSDALENIKIKDDTHVEIDRKVLDIKEASELIGLSVKTIYKKTHLKEIPYYKIPDSNKIFFKKDELLEWLQKGRNLTNSEIAAQVEDIIPPRRIRRK